MRHARNVALATVLTFLPAAANAESPDNAAQTAIGSQIEAFLSGDAEKAYSFADPSVKRFFRNPEAFVGMVKAGYEPVYAPRNYSFGRFAERNDDAYQEVMVTGPKGREWIALYTLRRQGDGTYLITSCRLAPSNAQPI